MGTSQSKSMKLKEDGASTVTSTELNGAQMDLNGAQTEVTGAGSKDSMDDDLDTVSVDSEFMFQEKVEEAEVFSEKIVAMRGHIKTFRRRQASNWDLVDKKVVEVDYKDFEYPFENLVFEGGGNKGLAYCGALSVLEEIGLSKNIKRIAGTSAGAMTAALFAIGYSASDIQGFLGQNIGKVFKDHQCGYLSLLPNLLSKFGWNPGNRIYEWFGDKVYKQVGDADYTFKQLYDNYGIELCIVVTNLNQMNTIYCHPKTSPEMPIRMAVRMSLAIPGMFAATKYTSFGHEDVYVDGGVLCNYPIHCFDGWWLSMAKEDGFFRRLRPLSLVIEKMEKEDRFGTFNAKTLGFLLYANHEQDIYRTELESRRGVDLPVDFPNSKLFRTYMKTQKFERQTAKEHSKAVMAVDAFFEALHKHDIDEDELITLSELEAAFEDKETFSTENAEYLFGPGITAKEAFKDIVKDGSDSISFGCLTVYLEKTGIDLGAKFLGYKRCDINNFVEFLDTLQTTLLTNIKKVYMQKHDIRRTVGINTGYINTTDFQLDPEDRDFLVEQGRRSVISFLKYYAVNNNLKRQNTLVKIVETVMTKDDSKESFKECLNAGFNDSETPNFFTKEPVIRQESALNTVIE